MYSSNFDKAFKELIGHEGGYKCERADRMDWTGGALGKGELRGTKYGISAGTYPQLDIKNLSLEKAKDLYHRDFWARFGGDAMDYELAYQVFDAEVNHGRKTGVTFLQRALGVDADGIVGPRTLAALKTANHDKVIMRMLGIRLRFFTQIKTWNEYGRGWANRVANLLIAATE